MSNKIRPDPVQIWMLEASKDDLGQHAGKPLWTVRPPGSSSVSSGLSCLSHSGAYASGIQREEIEPYLSAIHADVLGADAQLLADALEVQVEALYRTTMLVLAAVQRIAESQTAYLCGIVSLISATMSLTPCGIPGECLPDTASTGGAFMLFGSGNNIAEFISEAPAELNDTAVDLRGVWFRSAQRLLWFA
jgi:hypothetical protein